MIKRSTTEAVFSIRICFSSLNNTHVENVLLQKYTGSEPDKKFLIEPNFSMQPKKDLMRLLLRIRSFCFRYAIYMENSASQRLRRPFLSNNCLSFFSVGKTGNISGKSCTSKSHLQPYRLCGFGCSKQTTGR